MSNGEDDLNNDIKIIICQAMQKPNSRQLNGYKQLSTEPLAIQEQEAYTTVSMRYMYALTRPRIVNEHQ